MPFSAKALLILLMFGFFGKKSTFFGKNNTLIQSNSVRAVLEIFSSVFGFCEIKVTVNEIVKFTDYASRIRVPNCS